MVAVFPQNQTTTTTEPNESSNVCSPNIRVQWNMPLLEAGSPLYFRWTPFATSKKMRWISICGLRVYAPGSNWYNHCSLIPMIYSLCGMDHPTLYIEYHVICTMDICEHTHIISWPDFNYCPWPKLQYLEIGANQINSFWVNSPCTKKGWSQTPLKKAFVCALFWSTVNIPPPQKKKTSASKASQKEQNGLPTINFRMWTPSFKKESLPKRTLEKSTFMAVAGAFFCCQAICPQKTCSSKLGIISLNLLGSTNHPNMFEDGDMICFGEKEGRNWGEKHANSCG